MAGSETEIPALLAAAARRYSVALSAAQLAQLESYIALVQKWGRIANLTGTTNAPTFARQHVVDSLAVVPHVGRGRLLDVGSGNGLPGIVLAIALPELAVTLLEPRAKRARFLTQARIDLQLRNLEVVRARVEAFAPAQPYDTLIARAFGALAEYLDATRALRGPRTRTLAMKGQLDAAEFAACALPPNALTSIALDVPGYADRHLVVLEAGAAAASGFVP